ncbi:hypothetical protein [Acinetobacter rudis]|uniref:Peptidase MA-like domain-containing protein n=1 Tax=Acinetobacter rudis CIP 110305 TaxID=421052 RepID=S3N6Y5_9GAMM|nr:hypothetical protein [Acinetobacter rudis]EPF75627.1 hypothetical protein F945_01294 [Acinetobacter rudis CIP 110305]
MRKFILVAICLSIPSIGLAASVCNIDKKNYNSLEKVYKLGKIRVFYSTNPTSVDKLPHQTDLNNNSIPDYVEDVALQAKTAGEALNYLGFTDPLESKRYKGVAEYIDINLVSESGGVAYEIPQRADTQIKENKCALLIQLTNNISDFPGSWSIVSHELFHLYQYGYAQFKRGWYGEGSANWAERVIRVGGHKYVTGPNPLPQNMEELKLKVYAEHYNNLWSRLAELSEKNNGAMLLPTELLNRKYVNGSKVIKDDQLNGYAFMIRFMDNLRIKSEQISFNNNWDPYAWGANKRLESNNAIILAVIQDTMHQFGMNKTKEEQEFLNIK